MPERLQKELIEKINDLERRLQLLEKALLTQPGGEVKSSIPMAQLLELPDSMRKSLLAMQSLGEGTADAVAEKTSRTRTLENIHLNQLVRMGYLSKARRSRKMYFKIAKLY